MFSRRSGSRFNRGRTGATGGSAPPPLIAPQSFTVEIVASTLEPLIAAQSFDVGVVASLTGDPAGPLAPLSIVTSKTALLWLHGDLGVDESDAAGRVRIWENQAAATDAQQLTAAVQPGYATAVLNGHNVVSGNAADRFLSAAIALPAPGTTPTWIFAVFRQTGWVNGHRLFAGSAATSFKVGGSTTTPSMNLNNTNAGPLNGAATVNSWFRMRALFNNATSDYLRIGSTNATGTNLGNATASAIGLFGLSGGGSYGAYSLACIGVWNGEPSAGELSALDTWVTAEFGGSVGL